MQAIKNEAHFYKVKFLKNCWNSKCYWPKLFPYLMFFFVYFFNQRSPQSIRGITMSFSSELWITQFVVLLKSQRDGDPPSFIDRDGDSHMLSYWKGWWSTHCGSPSLSVRQLTVSAHIEPWGSIFQNEFLDGVQFRFRCVFIKICPFLLYLSVQNVIKHTIVNFVGLYSRVGCNM